MSDRYNPYAILTRTMPKYLHLEDRAFITDCAFKLPTRFRTKALIRYYKVVEIRGRKPANEFFARIADLSALANCTVGMISDGNIVIKAKRMSQTLLKSYQRYGYQGVLDIALIHIKAKFLPDIKKLETEERMVKRLFDESWWRRALRAQRKQVIESIARDVNLVNRYAGLYVTDESIKLRESQKTEPCLKSVLQSTS